MKLRNAAAAIMGTAFLAMALIAQVSAMIEGTVTGVDGKPLMGAVIRFTGTVMRGNYQVKTDKRGHFIQTGLQVGAVYNVALEVDGKKVVERQNVTAQLVDINNPLTNTGVVIDFDLKKLQAANAATQKALNEAATTGQISDDLSRQLTDEQKEEIQRSVRERAAALKKDKDLNDNYSAGMEALDAKHYEQAIPLFEKAAEAGPKQRAVWENLGEAYLALASTKTGADFDSGVQKGMDAYNKAIALAPDEVSLHTNYARWLALCKKFAEAGAEADKIAQISPGGAGKAYYNLGVAFTNAGQSEPAAESFRKGMAANHADAAYQYGLYLAGKAQVDTATGKITPAPGTVEAFQKYLELSPTGPNAQPAKDMIASLGGSVGTSYSNPAAPKDDKKAATTTKKK